MRGQSAKLYTHLLHSSIDKRVKTPWCTRNGSRN